MATALRRVSILAVAVAVGVGVACGPKRVTTWELAEDLLATHSPSVNGEPVVLQESLCADETWASIPLEAGDELVIPCRWPAGSRLELMGCASAPAHPGLGLQWLIETGGDTTAGEVLLAGEPGWWRRSIGLPAGDEVGVVTVTVNSPSDDTVWLREAVIRVPLAPDRPQNDPIQILLISVDTLRADAVRRLGGGLHPGFARFLAEADSWPVHYAGSSWTLPSHATMLTGVPAWVHGAVARGFEMQRAVPTLAERFRDAGLRTGATVFGSGWLKPDWGFDRGFESYVWERWRVDRLARRVTRWIHDHRDQSFFHFFHTFEPHSDFEVLPYEAPAVTRQTIEHRFAVSEFGCRGGRCASDLLAAMNRGLVAPTDADRRVLPHLYREGVRFTVEALGELFDNLRSAGLWDSLTVVVTSDHGEEFFEHGRLMHDSLYQEVLRVPLWIKWRRARGAGVVRGTPTSSADLAPTLLELIGEADDRLQGAPLRRPAPGRAILAGDFDKAVVADGRKAIFGVEPDHRELYDLTADPGERLDLSAEQSGALDELQSWLADRVTEDRERWGLARWTDADRERVQLTPEEEARLRALGYLD